MSTKVHFDYLDSLRGVACMIVVVMHALIYIYPGLKEGTHTGADINYGNALLYPPCGILIAGHAAVCLFFVLSGFVLSYRFMGEAGMSRKIIEATVKRPVRLIGAITASLLYLLDFVLTAKFWTGAGDCEYYYTSIRLVHRVFFCQFGDDVVLANPPLWTIRVELWGSALVFGICLLIGNAPKLWRMVMLCVLALCLKDTYFVAFVIGMIVVDLYKNWSNAWFIKHKNIMSYVLLIPAVIYSSYPYYMQTPYWPNTAIIKSGYPMIGAVLLFIVVMCNDKVKQILNIKLLVFIGAMSYSIYLIHHVLLFTHSGIIIDFVYKHLTTNIPLSFLCIMTIYLTVVLFLSWLVDRFVDRPCIRFSSWFAKRLVDEIVRSRVYPWLTTNFKTIKAKCKQKGLGYARACLGMNVATSSESQDQ